MSTGLHANQIPVNGTVQVKVSPGCETGLYYILISNLPWNTSWQQLKDHVRAVCSVERVEVFNDSTSGWVMIRGKDNYDEALRLLSGGLFNGRPTFADGRNATQSIYIKELVSPSSATVPSPRTSRTSSQCQPSPPALQYHNDTQTLSPHATLDYGQWTTGAPTGSYVTSPTVDYLPRTIPVSMSYNYEETTAWYPYDTSSNSYVDQSPVVSPVMQYQYDTTVYQQSQPYCGEYGGHDYSSTNNVAVREPRPSKSNNNRFVQTERRKIIIRGLAAWTSHEQACELVRSKAGSDADKINKIELPHAQESQAIRGYATVTFSSEDAANKVIKRLNGCKLDGKTLKVEHTKEGVSRSEDNGHGKGGKSGHHHSSRHHREDRDRPERRESSKKEVPKKESSRSSGSHSTEKKDKSHNRKDVVIANGSSKKVGAVKSS